MIVNKMVDKGDDEESVFIIIIIILICVILTVIMTMRGCEQTNNMQGMNSSLEIVAILIMNREYSSQFLVA